MLLLLLACFASWPAFAGEILTVATYNVLYRNDDLPKLIQTIRAAEADVVALQETTGESERYLRAQLGKAYPHMAFRGGTVKSDGFGFLSKVPLQTLEFVPVKAPGRGGWIADLIFQGASIRIVSVHLSTPRVFGAKTIAGMIQVFEQSDVEHATEIRQIYQKGRAARPTIVLGDFNSLSFGRAVQYLVKEDFTDTFAALTPDAEQHGTWKAPAEHATVRNWQIRLDYILATPHFTPIKSRIITSEASDHSLVVSTLRLKKANRE